MKFLSYSEKIRLYWKATLNMTYLGGNKKLSPPIIAWVLTRRCNLTCKHCTSYLDQRKIESGKLMQLAKKIAASDSMVIIISGGEPLMVPNIKEIITILKKSGKIVKINTNGYNLDKLADFMIDTEVDCITVSIDGIDAETHDDIRGKDGSYARAINNLEYIKKNRRNGKPFTEVRGVLMKENFTMMPEYIEKFKQVVDEVGFQPIHNHKAHHEVVEEGLLFSEADKATEIEFEEMMINVAKENPEFNNSYYKSFPKFLFHPDQMEEQALHACLPTWMNFMPIDEVGDCHTCTQIIGNLFDGDVESIWCGDKRIGFLRSISKFGKCKSPCWLNCTSTAPEWMGSGLKAILKLGKESETARQEFIQMESYTGMQALPDTVKSI